jgi:hypothetical protein
MYVKRFWFSWCRGLHNMIAVMLAVAVLVDPHNSQNEELEEWIALAVAVLRELGQINPVALNAVAGLHVTQQRVQLVVQTSGRGEAHPASNVPVIGIDHRLDRATHTLAQPQHAIVDSIGETDLDDPLVVQHRIPEFSGNFPGIEFLCSSNGPHTLESFLDTCVRR